MDRSLVVGITGASRGIGLGMVEYFTAHGHHVAGCSRGVSTFAHDLYLHTQVDVTKEQQVRQWVRAVKSRRGRFDVLICCAAIVPPAALMLATSTETVEDVMRTNVVGAYVACREAAKAMMTNRFGRIITISSIAVGLHDKGTSAYASSKSALVELTKIMAKELASSGITCNVISPSVYMNSATESLGESVVADVLERLTIKRPLAIEEICNVAEFFMLPMSGCITGQVLEMGLVT